METRASYLIVGAFTLVLIIGAVAAVVWLADVEFDEEFAKYDIFFEGSVTGLKTGNPVRYRGVPVGVVTDMGINPKNVEQVRVTIEVPRDTPVKTDAVASLEFQGITGVAYVQISGGTQSAPNLTAALGERRPVIPSKSSGIQQVLEQAPELLNKIIGLVENANKILNEQSQKDIAATISNLKTITDSLAQGSGDVKSLISDGSTAVSELKEAAVDVRALVGTAHKGVDEVSTEAIGAMKDIRGFVGDVRGDSRILIDDLKVTVAAIKVASKNAESLLEGIGPDLKVTLNDVRAAASKLEESQRQLTTLIEENRTPISNFTSSGLFELTQLLSEARILMSALTRISGQIERDPARFFFGDSQRGVGVR